MTNKPALFRNGKYEATGETRIWRGRTLHRIRAIRSFASVNAGDLGGWIEKEVNLSGGGCAWVGDDALVCDSALVFGNAQVRNNAMVRDNARVCDSALVGDDALVEDDVWICGWARVLGNVRARGNAQIGGNTWISDDVRPEALE